MNIDNSFSSYENIYSEKDKKRCLKKKNVFPFITTWRNC